MDTRLLPAQALKTVGIGQHLAPLFGQGGTTTGHLVLLRHADLKHLLGFLPSRRATQSGQAQRDAIGVLDLAYPVLFGHPEQRFDRIRADREADAVETERRGGLELVLERARKLVAHGCGGDRVEQGRALGQRVVREALGFEHLLARQEGDGIVSKARDQRFARG